MNFQNQIIDVDPISLRLTANSRKGQQRLQRHGEAWIWKRHANRVQFDSRPGPWMLVESVLTGDTRWVHAFDDQDFVVARADGGPLK